ncbi:MAG: SDR family oxidoreductase [Clostridiales Family XIII bacterium]|jgi:NAD(P)-dependent dehydrogenase (short-subunit alcohol dehydrogenase family)|nr:SDR family oxidoreductase [Clostridiales Family XIII bacterium]
MKYALVTGSTRGIGFAIAAGLADAGYFVFTNGRGDMRAKPPGERYRHIKADLSGLEGVNALAETVLRRAPKLDCLVLNAGATCRKPFAETEYADWQAVMDTNVNMPFFLVRRLLTGMADGGSILFVSSAMGLAPHATSVSYGVSKAAVNMLARSLVKEFAPRGIRVNVICPGFIDTEWQREKPVWLREKIEGKVALGRFGSPGEVADMCLALIENSYVNGAVLSVDGGYDME